MSRHWTVWAAIPTTQPPRHAQAGKDFSPPFKYIRRKINRPSYALTALSRSPAANRGCLPPPEMPHPTLTSPSMCEERQWNRLKYQCPNPRYELGRIRTCFVWVKLESWESVPGNITWLKTAKNSNYGELAKPWGPRKHRYTIVSPPPVSDTFAIRISAWNVHDIGQMFFRAVSYS